LRIILAGQFHPKLRGEGEREGKNGRISNCGKLDGNLNGKGGGPLDKRPSVKWKKRWGFGKRNGEKNIKEGAYEQEHGRNLRTTLR